MSEVKVKLLPLTAEQIDELEATGRTLLYLSQLSGKPEHQSQYSLISNMVRDLRYQRTDTYSLPVPDELRAEKAA